MDVLISLSGKPLKTMGERGGFREFCWKSGKTA